MACIRAARSEGSSDDLSNMNSIARANKSIIQIYTDWANHYLEKSRSKKHIQDLQADVTDGVLLSDVIEAVTSQKVPDINRKPKSSSQMIDNINSCLAFLAGLGVSVDGICAKDVRDGNLKAILGLFFSLSRHKQQQKQQHLLQVEREKLQKQQQQHQQIQQQQQTAGEMPKLPSPFNKHGATSIPVPASVSARRSGAEKGRQLGPPGGGIGQQPGGPLKSASASSSRSTSPAPAAQSFIPTPRSARSSLNEKHLTGNRNGVGGVQSAGSRTSVRTPAPSLNSPYSATPTQQGKNSMLDKFKFFNSKEKNERSKGGTGVSKRTSSSSGFSSARSERSDSSTSLCSDAKPCSSSIASNETRESSPVLSSTNTITDSTSPKASSKGFRNKFGKGVSNSKEGKQNSPKTGRKEDGNKSSPKQNKSANNSGKETRDYNKEVREKGEVDAKHKDDRTKNNNESEKKVHKNDKYSEKVSYAPVLEVDNPIKQSKVSSLIPKTEAKTKSRNSNSHLPAKAPNSKDNLSEIPPLVNAQNQPANMANPQMTQIPGVGSGIPKPTAAVKGTTKVSKEDKQTSPVSNTAINNNSFTKDNSNRMVQKNSQTQYARTMQNKPTSPCKNEDSDVDNYKISLDSCNNSSSSSLPRQKQLGRNKDETGSNISVAMVSPMPSTINLTHQKDKEREKDSVPLSESGSNISESSHSNSTGQSNSNSSESSVIYRPSSESGSDISKSKGSDVISDHIRSPITCTKMETTFDSGDKVITHETHPNVVRETTFGEEEEVVMNVKPMQPLLRASQFGYTRGLGLSSRNLAPSVHVPRIGYQTETVGGNNKCLTFTRPYYNTHESLRMIQNIKRGMADGNYIDPDYSDIDAIDISAGYMSDGDVLRCGGQNKPTHESYDGYMSEGGASLYARRMQQVQYQTNNRDEKMIREDRTPAPNTAPCGGGCPSGGKGEPPPPGQAGSKHKSHRFDDSSSVSSGISDTIAEFSTDENLTSSSVHSEHSSPYTNYNKRPSREGSSAQKVPVNGVGLSVQSVRKTAAGPDPQIVYKVVGSRSHVKKSDSSQQTENSAFRQISNTQWKKYVENGKAPEKIQELRRGKSDLEVLRAKDKRNSGGSNCSNGSSNGGFVRKQEKKSNVNSERQRKAMGIKEDVSSRDRDYLCVEKVPKTDRGSPRPSQGSQNVRVNSEGKKPHSARGVPQSFGYIKRPTSTSSVSSTGSSKGGSSKTCRNERENNSCEEPKTAQVSAVPRMDVRGEQTNTNRSSLDRPRTKVKVSGGTQTTSDLQSLTSAHSDSEYTRNSIGHKHQYKSYSLTTPSAAQLSQNVRDRIFGSQSLPKSSTSSAEYAAFFAGVHGGYGRERSPRLSKITDGSLSDTAYSNYAELHGYYSGNSSPYPWLRHSSTYATPMANSQHRGIGAPLTEAESLESLSSVGSMASQLQQRASLTHARLMMHQRETSASPGPRLNRSNSIRSTKSEKLYPSMLQRSDDIDPYYSIPMSSSTTSQRDGHHSSQPTSPTPSQISQGTPSRFNFPMSPITSSASSHGLSRTSMSPYTGLLTKINSKDDDMHGSSLSLVSTASSLYSTPEEKQAHEIRKLRRELIEAQEKVHTLTSQLSTNAHVVSAFEQSLSNMTQRLQHLTATAERKDSELIELRQTIDLLRKQSVEAGLTTAHLQTAGGTNMSRQLSTDSVSSINSLSSACSGASHLSHQSSQAHPPDSPGSKKKKKKGWLRSSFSKAFSRSKKNKNGSVSDVEDARGLNSDVSAPSSPLLNTPHQMNGGQGIKISQSSSAIYDKESGEEGPEVVEDLKKQLREKDLVLTDIRLEALSSAHQLESLKDTVIKMRNEMMNLKQDNERLQRIVTSKSLTSSQSSLPITDSLERRFSMSEASAPSSIDPGDKDGKRVTVSVLLGSHGNFDKYMTSREDSNQIPETLIANVSVSGKTKWDTLDSLVRRVFKEYVLRVDPVSNLGLSAESVYSYHVGEVSRYKDSEVPELLPYGYLVGDTQQVRICLKGALQNGSVDALAFETLIPKSIVQRYVSLLTEHRRIILCGPSGTGKSYLANKLSEFLVLRNGKESTAEAIATFNVDHKSSKELRQYLSNVAEQCESNAADLPSVIILDNLHHAGSLGEVFNGFLNAKYSKCPYIIGTMNQATCSTTNLQLHHNFRWVLCANHMEPVKGFLGRYLRRRLLEAEIRDGVRNNDLNRILDWIPKVWQHLNKFLETHSSSDVTIGPRLFLSCPSDVAGSQVWFTDLWNYSVVPYLLEAVREGLQLYGRRAPWEDPAQFIGQTYPWTGDSVHGGQEALLRLRPEDVGYDAQASTGIGGSSMKSMSSTQSDTEGDPLLNMLMRLQEAANYSSPHSNDSDSTSLDSHTSSLQTEDMIGSGVESTL